MKKTNLRRFWLNFWSLKMHENNERKKPACCTNLCAFRCLMRKASVRVLSQIQIFKWEMTPFSKTMFTMFMHGIDSLIIRIFDSLKEVPGYFCASSVWARGSATPHSTFESAIHSMSRQPPIKLPPSTMYPCKLWWPNEGAIAVFCTLTCFNKSECIYTGIASESWNKPALLAAAISISKPCEEITTPGVYQLRRVGIMHDYIMGRELTSRTDEQIFTFAAFLNEDVRKA